MSMMCPQVQSVVVGQMNIPLSVIRAGDVIHCHTIVLGTVNPQCRIRFRKSRRLSAICPPSVIRSHLSGLMWSRNQWSTISFLVTSVHMRSFRCRTLVMSSDVNLFLTLPDFVPSVCVQPVSSFLSDKHKMGFPLTRDFVFSKPNPGHHPVTGPRVV